MAFIRVVGTAYFKYLSAIKQESPMHCLILVSGLHQRKPISTGWIPSETQCGDASSLRIIFCRHGKHCGGIGFEGVGLPTCGVRLHLVTITYCHLTGMDGELVTINSVDWNDATSMERVRKTVQLLLKGSRARKVGKLDVDIYKEMWMSRRECGPGCSCSNCEKSPTGTAPTAREIYGEVEAVEMQDQALRNVYASYLVDDNECDDEVDMLDELINDDGYTD